MEKRNRIKYSMLIFLLFLNPYIIKGEIIDKVLAKVNYRIISLSDLLIECRIQNIISGNNKKITEEFKSTVLSQLINRILVLQEIERLGLKQEYNSKKYKDDLNKFKNRFKNKKEFNKFLYENDIKEEYLINRFRNINLVSSYLEDRIKSEEDLNSLLNRLKGKNDVRRIDCTK
jgi:hypothetical protein